MGLVVDALNGVQHLGIIGLRLGLVTHEEGQLIGADEDCVQRTVW